MTLDSNELSEASIPEEVTRNVASCLKTTSSPSSSESHLHECYACGWDAEELIKVETRALRALLHLPNPIRPISDPSPQFLPDPSKETEKADEAEEVDMEQVSPTSRGSVQASMAVSEANFLVSECFAVVLRRAVEKEAWKLDLIGSHGQTVWHHPSTSKLIPSVSHKKIDVDHPHRTPKGERTECETHPQIPLRVDAAPSHHLHHSHLGRISSTLQIGDGSVLAARLGVTCVSNFRSADVARGGQGAPLTSSLDSFLLSHLANASQGWIALQNLGGMGNVTLIPSHALVLNISHHSSLHHHQQQKGLLYDGGSSNEEQEEKENVSSPFGPAIHPVAFDTGPANVLLDWFVSTHVDVNAEYDKGGVHAAQGRVNDDLLLHMISHPYFALSTPKTCGREVFTAALGEQWWKESTEGRYGQVSERDFLATLTDLTAASVVVSYLRFTPRVHHPNWYISSTATGTTSSTSPDHHAAVPSFLYSPFPSHIFISGGGSHNAHLMSRIEYYARLAQQGKLEAIEKHVFGDDSASTFIGTVRQAAKAHFEKLSGHAHQHHVKDGEMSIDPSSPRSTLSYSSPSPPLADNTTTSSPSSTIHQTLVSSHTATGISADEKESVLFALLAFLTIHGVPSSIPACTGAQESSTLGCISPGPNWRVLMKKALD